MNYSDEEVEMMRSMIKSPGYKLFCGWLKEVKEAFEASADEYSSNITTLLRREQSLGAAKVLSSIPDDFQNHVSYLFDKVKQKEKDNDNAK